MDILRNMVQRSGFKTFEWILRVLETNFWGLIVKIVLCKGPLNPLTTLHYAEFYEGDLIDPG